ncbi:MAG: spore coat protein CotJB [Ignavibacteriales bacterium]
MNDYNKTKDYYNYVNNNYNQPMYDQDQNKINLFDPYNGFIRGNMFPNLYNGYKTQAPFEIRPMNEQAEMLTGVDAYGFAAHDLNLYLDVYPEDKKMIELFNQYRGEKNKVVGQYEQKYGPLSANSNALVNVPWAWDMQPWPWENNR